jgi:RNA polymerase sigma factor (sigma-70 family)
MSQIDWVACERLIGNLAPKFCQDGLDLEDLKQEARLAVLESYKEYSAELGVSLQTFLGRRIRDSLRKFTSQSLDTVEVSREWVAESITDGPRAALRAKTKEDCELLRSVVGESRFKKPRRVIETMRATVSLDECMSEEDALSLHEVHGARPGQEAVLAANRQLCVAEEAEAEALVAGHHGGGDWAEMSALRSAGWTLAQIGKKLGKSPQAVRQALLRADRRVSRKTKAA